jgi:hypothetical protein
MNMKLILKNILFREKNFIYNSLKNVNICIGYSEDDNYGFFCY